jgi:MFS family permease
MGITGFAASLLGGWLWDHVGHAAVFVFGAAFAAVGIIACLKLIPAAPTWRQP